VPPESRSCTVVWYCSSPERTTSWPTTPLRQESLAIRGLVSIYTCCTCTCATRGFRARQLGSTVILQCVSDSSWSASLSSVGRRKRFFNRMCCAITSVSFGCSLRGSISSVTTFSRNKRSSRNCPAPLLPANFDCWLRSRARPLGFPDRSSPERPFAAATLAAAWLVTVVPVHQSHPERLCGHPLLETSPGLYRLPRKRTL